jgi:acyl phosphate:glycerol-3-phosphate acyltransferase
MDTSLAVLGGVIGYIFGSISFARIVTRLFAPQADLTKLQVQLKDSTHSAEVGIVGANAASMVLGPRLGLAIAVLDMLKVIIPMLVVWGLNPENHYHLVVSVGGLIGHNWPVYYRFKGGRGFAVIFGSFIALDVLGAIACTLGGLALGMMVIGNTMIAYISWLWLMIPWMAWRLGTPGLVYALVINLIFILATIPEMRLMLRMRREGKYREYMEGLYGSSPRWRGMKKMSERLWLLRPLFHKQTSPKLGLQSSTGAQTEPEPDPGTEAQA